MEVAGVCRRVWCSVCSEQSRRLVDASSMLGPPVPCHRKYGARTSRIPISRVELSQREMGGKVGRARCQRTLRCHHRTQIAGCDGGSWHCHRGRCCSYMCMGGG